MRHSLALVLVLCMVMWPSLALARTNTLGANSDLEDGNTTGWTAFPSSCGTNPTFTALSTDREEGVYTGRILDANATNNLASFCQLYMSYTSTSAAVVDFKFSHREEAGSDPDGIDFDWDLYNDTAAASCKGGTRIDTKSTWGVYGERVTSGNCIGTAAQNTRFRFAFHGYDSTTVQDDWRIDNAWVCDYECQDVRRMFHASGTNKFYTPEGAVAYGWGSDASREANRQEFLRAHQEKLGLRREDADVA